MARKTFKCIQLGGNLSPFIRVFLSINKTGTSKVGAISKAQKAQSKDFKPVKGGTLRAF